MQILIIGNSYTSKQLSNAMADNKDNIVFTTAEGTSANYINIPANNIEEIKDFALANEIGLSIVADFSCFDKGYFEEFKNSNLTILCPDLNSLKICIIQ